MYYVGLLGKPVNQQDAKYLSHICKRVFVQRIVWSRQSPFTVYACYIYERCFQGRRHEMKNYQLGRVEAVETFLGGDFLRPEGHLVGQGPRPVDGHSVLSGSFSLHRRRRVERRTRRQRYQTLEPNGRSHAGCQKHCSLLCCCSH